MNLIDLLIYIELRMDCIMVVIASLIWWLNIVLVKVEIEFLYNYTTLHSCKYWNSAKKG